ncbi:hypothetical protein KNV77_gp014 [Klebsiella phage vB_KpnP_P184]|uniref:Uncharacterized protein n=1 Tax=Klebsiella phage vB_KpnP_P184 TaxID=2806547 RepID=A0A898KAP4_9CAUD|nr:hypothetical protein KNV77_gp014 [Klebsiella phage vB_KpnP_P184]QSJ03687.1 hypothetical protein [Klebsiella phage vB_KpnP_P184]
MLIELSTLNTPRKPFWEVDSKQPPIYSLSEAEIKKAKVQNSIGIDEPRVNVSKLRIKMGIKVSIKNVVFLNDNKAMKLYKDDQGFYLKEIDW